LEEKIPKNERDDIVNILEERIVGRMRSQRTKEDLVFWEGRGLEEAAWISKVELE
jgi:hypothetical protein